MLEEGIMKGLILAGGHATRLRPLTYTINKHLIPIANKPIIYYVIEEMVNAGIKEIGIILGINDPESIRNELKDGSEFGVKITYIIQGEPKGIAHAIECAKDFLGKDCFIVYLGDNVLKGGIKKFVDDFRNNDSDACLLLTKVKHPERYGLAEVKDNKVVKLMEKPKNPTTNLAITGIYFLRPNIFEQIKKLKPSKRGELEITEALQGLVDSNKKIKIYMVEGWWKDMGTSESLLEANQLVLEGITPKNEGELEENVKTNGKISIGKNTIIRKNSIIKGPVIIGENCDIGPNTYIGPYTSIGNNVKITGGEIESSIIMKDSVIETNKKIVNSLIGMESIILSEDKELPKGYKLILGRGSNIKI